MLESFDLGSYSRRVTTRSKDAQLWFDRGLIWTYAYNHDLAIECFQKALECDPDCAMAHWGIAYAIGPNYNFEWWMMDPTTKTKTLNTAYEHTQLALFLVKDISAVERALIQVLPARYPQREPTKSQFYIGVSFVRQQSG